MANQNIRLKSKQDQISQKSFELGNRYSVVSLFSGCGGMDLGFRGGFEFLGRPYDALPFNVVWANDVNKAACRTYRRNLGPILAGDIWDLIDTIPKEADVVVGGFPCQDISVNNGKGRGIEGQRSGLYRAMVEVVSVVKPKIFVAENVRGLLMKRNAESLAKVLADFSSLGYEVSYQLYSAANYGVPQLRDRVIITGTLPTVPAFVPPVPTHSVGAHITAKQAIEDLSDMSEDPMFSHVWSRARRSPQQGDRRLVADRPGYTIRAEHHGNIQFHYSLPRRISTREAARLQSFPDDFVFEARLRETERQIGNAVPPVLAWHVAKSVLRCLEVTPSTQQAESAA